MFNIGGGELLLIAVLALLVLGPQRLPEMARSLGKVLREFRRHTDSVRGVVEQEFYKMDSDIQTPASSPEASSRPSPSPEGAIARGGLELPSEEPKVPEKP